MGNCISCMTLKLVPDGLSIRTGLFFRVRWIRGTVPVLRAGITLIAASCAAFWITVSGLSRFRFMAICSVAGA